LTGELAEDAETEIVRFANVRANRGRIASHGEKTGRYQRSGVMTFS
jgi:hypothetical protein